MKRLQKLVCVLLFCVMAVLPGCVPKSSSQYSETAVNIAVLNGGFGLEWIQKLAAEYNELHAEDSEYKVVIVPTTVEEQASLSANISAGLNYMNACFWSHSSIRMLIEAGQLVDVSDVYDYKFEGESKTIGEKCLVYDLAVKAYGGDDGGIYALPNGDSMAGLVFDYDLFVQKGWLMTDDSGNLTAGPDGIPNTYDDGQPVNMDEWNTMLSRITAESDTYPFIYSTKYPLYADSMLYGLMAQYMGDDFETFFTYDGTFQDKDGNTVVTVTPDKGYEIYKHPGIDQALRFFDEMLVRNESYVHTASYMTTSTTHRDAQDYMINGVFSKSATTPIGAMLIEGNWWENEARSSFDALAKRNKNYGFGQREYRYMLYPAADGQKGKSSLVAMENGASFVIKTPNEEKNAIAVDFLKYTLKEESLQTLTVTSGCFRPYEYSLTKEQREQLTPFQRNVWDMYHDTEHLSIQRPYLMRAASPLARTATLPSFLQAKVNNVPYDYPVTGLRYVTADQYIQGMYDQWKDDWNKYYEPVKNLFG